MPAPSAAYSLDAVTRRAAGRVVLDDITLHIPASQMTVLAGPSGSGKTSLLRLLNRLDDPTDGDIMYRGHPIDAYDVTTLRRRVGFVFQKPILFPGTVSDNLREAADIMALAEDARRDAFARVLDLAEVDESLGERNGSELSVGQQQRVTIARALLSQPETLLLDEPTSALDPDTSSALLRTIAGLVRDQGLTVVLSTHRMEEIRAFADVGVRLEDGRVQRRGPAAEVLAAGTRAAPVAEDA